MVGVLADLGYPAESTTYEQVTANPGWYDVVVANSAEETPTPEVVRAFIEATDTAGTSVVWLDTWGRLNGSIDHLSAATGDPPRVSYDTGGGRVSMVPTVEHPLTEGLPTGTATQVLNSGVWWSAFHEYSGTVVAGLRTDDDGDLGEALAYQLRSRGSVHVLVSSLAADTINRPAEDWTPAAFTVLDNAVSYAIAAEPGEVTGTVTDADGQPLVGARVVAVGTGRSTTTASDGRYRLLLEPGSYTLRFRAAGKAVVERSVDVTAGSTQVVDASLVAAGLGTVSGTVTSRDGTPIAGATVALDNPAYTATTAADGTYTLTGVPAETYTLTVSAEGWFTVDREVTVAAGTSVTVDVALRDVPHVGILGDDSSDRVAAMLRAAGMTTEELTFSSTARIPELDVVVFNDPASTTAAVFDTWLRTMDEHDVSGVFGDGFFAGDGGVRLLRQHTGNPSAPRVPIEGQVGEIRFTALDPGHPVFDGLRSTETVMLPNRESTAIEGYSGFPVATVASEFGGEHGIAITYQPRTESSVHLLLGGLVSTSVQYPDRDWTPAGKRLYANAVLFAAQPSIGSVSGTVSGVEGVPVRGTVTVDGTDQEAAMAADGSYALHLPPGDYTLRFAGFGYAETTREVTVADGTSTTLDATLAPQADAGSVTGVVTSDGAPVSGATVRLLGAPRTAVTGADGSYELPLVEAGDYQVDVTASGHLRDRTGVTVAAGEAAEHDVALHGTATVGVVDDYQGRMAGFLSYWGYQPVTVAWTDTARLSDLDLVVANLASSSGVDPGAAGLRAFDEAALRAGVSVLWLDQFGRGSFRYLTSYIGDPGGNDDARTAGPVTATAVEPDHPILAGLPASFELTEPDNEHSWFTDFDGRTIATVMSEDVTDGGLVGVRARGAAGVDVLLGTLSVSLYGYPATDTADRFGWTAEAELLLRNALGYALDAPAQGGQVEGVLRSDSGPVAGSVTVVETGRRYPVADDGAYLIGLPAGTWTLRGEATNHGSAEVEVTVSAGESVARDVVLTLLPAGDLSGTVTDTDGAPLVDAQIAVVGTAFTATTAADGSYRIAGIPEGRYVVTATAPGHQTARGEVEIVADQTATADLRLGASLGLALVDDSGGSLNALLSREGYAITTYTGAQLSALTAAITDYDVIVVNDGFSGDEVAAFATLLDVAAANGVSIVAGGQFGGDAIDTLRDLRGDPATLDDGFVPNPISYRPTSAHPIFAGFPVGEPITIIDDPDGGNQQFLTFGGYSGSTIADVVSDGDGADLGHGVGFRYTSGSSVEVLLASLGAGTYGRPGDEWTAAGERIYLNAVHFAATAKRGELSGVVSSGGAPVEGATVSVEGAGSVTTDAQGHYAIGVTDGTWTVRVEAVGYEPATAEVTVADAASVTHDVDLSALPRHPVTGTVTDVGGTPVAGATVTATGVEDWSATTGADGRFTVPGLLDGEYEVRVAADGYLEEERTVAVAGPTTIDVSLTAIDVAVLGDVNGELVDFLRDQGVAAGELAWSDATELAPYDVVVVNGDGGTDLTDARFGAFEAAAGASEAGVVYTGTWGSEGGVRLLDEFTDRVEAGVGGYGQGTVELTKLRKHELFSGLGTAPTLLVEGGYYGSIESYDGTRLADQRVATDGGQVTGIGAAYDWLDRSDVEVLLASMAVTDASGPNLGWTEQGERLLINAVEFARSP
jgi:hypothetical protein